jgi:predicted aldo/keto reductase-like oxidoreductase
VEVDVGLKTIRFGKTGLQITQLGFGGIPIQRLTEDQAVAVVKRCLELGITFYDTANGYSTSEERIGKAIAGQRDRVVIATKTPPMPREMIEKNLKLSLTRLQVDCIDLYQLHGVSDFKALDFVFSPGGPLEVLQEAKQAGLIKHIGITSHQIDVAAKAAASDKFESLMFPFNFLSTEVAEKLLPVCRAHDVGFIAMKPLAGGMVENAGICFKYLLQFPDIAIIPGIEKIAEIDEIYRIIQGPLEMSQAEKAEMERIRKELGTSFCHRCDYCQPCTAQIPISMVMTVRSFYKRLPPERFFGDMVVSGMEKAVGCTDCGKCEERCPYHLPIRKIMQEQVDWFNEERKKYQESCKK